MKNTKFFLTCLIAACFSCSLFAQTTYVNGWDTFNLVFTTNNVQRMEIFKNGKIQMSPLVDGNKGLVTFDSSGNIRPLNFNGNSGTVLTGNGAFTNISAISLWQQNSSKIYYNAGNVGIGTTDPHYPLQVVGNIVDSGSLFATNIATFNSISVGQFKLVAGVVDSIITTTGTLQLSATVVNADGSLTAAQTLTAGTTDTAITINGYLGTITSPLKTISFGNDTLTTTGAIKAGEFKASYFKADSVYTSVIIPHDSILYLGDPTGFVGTHYNMSLPPPSVSLFPRSFYSSPNTGFSFVNSPTSVCPTSLTVGSEFADAELNVTGPCGDLLFFSITNTSLNKDVFTVDASGNTNVLGKVVIGSGLTTPGNYGLYVGNGVLTSLVKIALPSDNVNWSDYVFANNYKLKPLTEVAQYIKANKHLPDVPSATDIKKDGINVADMDATLLKKIEELTLYMIQQQKQSEEQKQLSEQQQKEIQDLKAQLEKMQNKEK